MESRSGYERPMPPISSTLQRRLKHGECMQRTGWIALDRTSTIFVLPSPGSRKGAVCNASFASPHLSFCFGNGGITCRKVSRGSSTDSLAQPRSLHCFERQHCGGKGYLSLGLVLTSGELKS